MAKSKQAIKSRIRAIEATGKITKAMELVAISKLRRQSDMLEKNKEYAENLKKAVLNILYNSQSIKNRYLIQQEDTAPLAIIFSSDIGLCGGYNTNMMKYAATKLQSESEIMLIGIKNRLQLSARGYEVDENILRSDSMNYIQLSKLADKLLSRYEKGEITSISILYTKTVNSMSFEPCLERLLPFNYDIQKETSKEILYEPNAEVILNELIPMYVKSSLYTSWLETTKSEQSSRRLAMSKANDNADELIEQLTLDYNQARQAAITQEISEIVSAADAL